MRVEKKQNKKRDLLKKIYLIAFEYYVNGKTQQEIADQLGINRVLVSRYLKQARELGLIEIKLKDPFSDAESFRKLLMDRFNLLDVIVVPFPFYEGGEENLISLGVSFVIENLNKFLKNRMLVGIGWGSTLELISNRLSPSKQLEETTFVPLTGGTNRLPHYFHTNDFVKKFAESYNANAKYLFAPFFIEDKTKKDYLFSSKEIKEILELWGKLDVALVGIGCYIRKSPLFLYNIFDEKYLRELLDKNVVGDVLTHFFDENGKVVHLDVYENLVNIPMDMFLKIKTRVGIAGGFQKVQAIVGALKGKLVNVLITDIETANLILKYIKMSPEGDKRCS